MGLDHISRTIVCLSYTRIQGVMRPVPTDACLGGDLSQTLTEPERHQGTRLSNLPLLVYAGSGSVDFSFPSR